MYLFLIYLVASSLSWGMQDFLHVTWNLSVQCVSSLLVVLGLSCGAWA